MKKIIIHLIIITLILNYQISAKQNKFDSQDINLKTQNIIDDIYNTYGVKIIFDIKKMMPKPWFYSPIKARILKMDYNFYDSTLNIIKLTLKKYSKKVLQEHLHSICLCGSLYFYGVEYGGTAVYENHSIILTIKDCTKEDWIKSTINHEFNHLLVYWNDFPKEKWLKCNDINFEYGSGGIAAIQSGQSNTDRISSNFEEGFVCEYAKSDFFEDAATMFEYAVSDWDDFYNRALNYSIIKDKFEILKEFYYNIDSSFDETFWFNDKNNNAVIKKDIINYDDEYNSEGLLNEEDQYYLQKEENSLY